MHSSYADRVSALLDRLGLPPSALVLEVTESSLAGETDAALDTLRRLRSLGPSRSTTSARDTPAQPD